MKKEMLVTLYYIKPHKKNQTIYHKPYVWRSSFKNAKGFKENDVVAFVGSDNHKHYGFVYKKEIHELQENKKYKWLIPYTSKEKETGRKLKHLFYDDWKKFKETNKLD